MLQRSERYEMGENAAEIQREVKMNWSTCCFPTPLPVSADTHLPASVSHTHTPTASHSYGWLGDHFGVQLEYHWPTNVEKVGHLRVLPHFLREGGLLFVLTRVWRGPDALCLTSQWIMVSLPLLSTSLPLSLSARPWPLVDSVLPQAHCQGLTTRC